MKMVKHLLLTILLGGSLTAQAASQLIIVRNHVIEQHRIEVIYNKRTNSGQLYARDPNCSACNPIILSLDNTARVYENGKQVSFDKLLSWKNTIVDIEHTKKDDHVVAVRRY